MRFLSGAKKLPTKSDMLKDMHIHSTIKRPLVVVSDEKEYIQELSKDAAIEGVPEVFSDIMVDVRKLRIREPSEYHKYKYTIIDGKHFVKEKSMD